MTLQTGSRADHERLVQALDIADRMERVAELLNDAATYRLADQAYLRLIPIARLCGYQWSASVSVGAWARKRVAAFKHQTQGASR